MKQFILSGGPDKNGKIKFEGDDYRYLAKSRRLTPGECFPALLPDGGEILLRVCSVENGVLTGEIAGENAAPKPKEGELQIILFQALPKGDKMDLIVRQAAECGLAEIVPFVSEFSAAGTGVGGQKFSRWERIIKEARQQSGSAVATTVRRPMSVDGIFAYWEEIKEERPGPLGLLFHHLPLENESLHGYLGKSLQDDKPAARRVITAVLAIGPEGGFSPAEAERFAAAGFRPFTFATAVLRTETAALYAAAAVQVLLTERDSWKTK